jgi:ATP-dependent DNA helicase RecG
MGSSLQSLITQGEGQTIEFKTTFGKEAIESVVAFANAQGGKVCIGISDKGKIIGVGLQRETLQSWINQIKTTTQPSIIVDIKQITAEDKIVVVVDVKEYPVKPISYKNRYFVRKANSNHLMNMMEISNMHLQSLQLSWDAYTSNDTKMDDLDSAKMDVFFQRVNAKGRFRLGGTREENLQKLNLVKDASPTNAAKLLFAKDMRQYSVHIGRFKTPTTIIDDKMIQNTLYETVEEIMNFILSHMKVAFEFTGEVERVEIFEYPQKAL